MNEIILVTVIAIAAVYFFSSAKKRMNKNNSSRIKQTNADLFINGMSEENETNMYASRTFTRGFTAAKAKDGTYLFIKQAKLTDSGLAY